MIYVQPGFSRRYKNLTAPQRQRVDAAVAKFGQSVGNPHRHSGIGLRPFGHYLEFRARLDLRILALAEGGDYFMVCVGNHDEIRAYVKNR